MAKMLWHFEIELGDGAGDGDWADQRVFTLNETTPLMVRLRGRG